MLHRPPTLRQQGAALLLLVAVLGMGASFLLIGAFSQQRDEAARVLNTSAALTRAKEALIGYAILYGRLPRPAVSATDGHEMSESCAAQACTGYLPWVTLGVDGTDVWGKVLRYSVSPAFTQAPIRPASAIADKKIVGRDSVGAQYYLVGEERCGMSSRCTPAVVYSNGKNNFGTSVGGQQLANAALGNVDEQQNASDSTVFISRRRETDQRAAGGEFDDQLVWIPLQILYRRMEAADALPTQ